VRSFGSRSTDRSEGRSGPQIIPFGRDRWTDAFDVACFRAWTLRVSNGERRISARTAVVHRNSRAGPNMLQRQSFQLGGALLAFSPPKSDAWLIHGHINRLSDRPPQRGWRLAGSRAAAIWVRGLPSGDGSVDVGIAVIVANGLHQRMQIGAGVLNEVRCRPQEKEWVDAKLVKALATPALRRDCTTPGTWPPGGRKLPERCRLAGEGWRMFTAVMFTAARLGIDGRLANTLTTSNPIESMVSVAGTTTSSIGRYVGIRGSCPADIYIRIRLSSIARVLLRPRGRRWAMRRRQERWPAGPRLGVLPVPGRASSRHTASWPGARHARRRAADRLRPLTPRPVPAPSRAISPRR